MTASFVTLPERLKRLPDFEPRPGGWARLVNQLERRPPPRRRVALAPLALAASVLAAVGVAWLLPTDQIVPVVDDGVVAQLMQQSQHLEQTLQTVRPQVAVWDGRLAATAAHLRDDLAVVDLQLSYASNARPAAVERLWQNRVALMTQLVETHRGATLAPASDPDSLEQFL